jgi:hypothetical protein
MKPDRVAVELNREIAPRNTWLEIQIKDGDRLEIVHFVGGGNFLGEILVPFVVLDFSIGE